MENKGLEKKPLINNEYLYFRDRIKLSKETKWVSYGTYIMTVENFGYDKGVKDYQSLMGTVEYKSESFVVNLKYNDENYYINNKELYNNVSKGDKIVVTVKYNYDKEEKLIHSSIHQFHPYPISDC